MLELDPEEQRLLAEAQSTEPPAVEHEPLLIDGAPKVELSTDSARRRPRPPRRGAEPPRREPVAVPDGPSGPEADNPTVPPAQVDYGDPWGLLPVQMRHHNDGTLAP